MTRTTSTHQLLLLAVAVALVAGLFWLPKVVVKPKEGRGELTQDAARTATRDGGGTATNGSKAVASSGEQPTAVSPEQPHMALTPAQRQELNSLRSRYASTQDPAAKLRLAKTLADTYKAAEKHDSAGYYLEQLALARPGEQAWQRAADEYFEAFSFATTAERQRLLGAKCQELYQKVLKNNPDNLDAKNNLGMAFMVSDNPMQGVTLLREVLAADPRNEKVLYNLGLLAIKSGQYDKAVGRFQELTKVNPENVDGQFYLGVSLAQTGAKQEARQAFLKAKSLSPDPALAASVDEELQKLQ
ncbi:tetratricopeptide repeat protein [Hymenobacter weizhouensis]|uniref:tetratricopeptide repeat protein n=1 Tax=Hymenobacter sp. YIM 151500-1 TaxID=2987689 RepID=UPI002227E143|nr:tetratricopeptide repeat protein [Hymenobacter sp. YIM 151500-1]UYZ61806.1 tetratricopeptide repeat protein [Hymenobacter sp. YIM 151500-1]